MSLDFSSAAVYITVSVNCSPIMICLYPLVEQMLLLVAKMTKAVRNAGTAVGFVFGVKLSNPAESPLFPPFPLKLGHSSAPVATFAWIH